MCYVVINKIQSRKKGGALYTIERSLCSNTMNQSDPPLFSFLYPLSQHVQVVLLLQSSIPHTKSLSFCHTINPSRVHTRQGATSGEGRSHSSNLEVIGQRNVVFAEGTL